MNTNEWGLPCPVPLAAAALPRPAARWPYRIALFISMFGLIPLGAGQASGDGSALREILWLGLAFFGLPGQIDLGLSRKWHGVCNISMLVLFLFFFYCALSSFWSLIPFVTFKRTVLLGVVISIGYSAFGRDDVDGGDFICMTAQPVFLLLLLSFVCAVADPGWAITSLGWRGVTDFKNDFGNLCAVSILCSVCLYGAMRPLHCLAMLLLSIAGLVMSQSATCLVSMMVALGVGAVILLFQLMKSRPWLQIGVLGLSLAILLVMYLVFAAGLMPSPESIPKAVLSVLGRSPTLTGRTKLWDLVLDYARYHNHWLGGGYGGFWNGLNSPAGFTAWAFGGGYVGESHNGYIEIYNDLGYIGLAGMAIFFVFYFRNIHHPSLHGKREYYFHLCYAVFILMLSCTESPLFRTVNFLNCVMLASYVRVAALSFRHELGEGLNKWSLPRKRESR